MDGVLFIAEAYRLIQTGLSGGDAFGREAVDTLLARMENDRDRLVVIIAGYEAEIDRFLSYNEVWRLGSPNGSGSSPITRWSWDHDPIVSFRRPCAAGSDRCLMLPR